MCVFVRATCGLLRPPRRRQGLSLEALLRSVALAVQAHAFTMVALARCSTLLAVMSTGASDQPWGSKGNMKDVITTNYTLETAGGGTQDNMQWGAWCSFCHQHQSHGRDEDVKCTSGHMHGSGNAF